MAKPTLWRASAGDLSAVGRIIEGVALPWDTPAEVTDYNLPGRPTYYEAFASSAFDRSLEQRPEPRPVFDSHEYALPPALRKDVKAEPIGVAHFERSNDGLVFRAIVSRTRKGDEQLALVRDGAKRDVSVGFRPIRSTKVARPIGLVTLRTEAALNELSLAPTGWGQYPEAKVLAMRTAGSATPRLDAIREQMAEHDRKMARLYERYGRHF